MPKRLDVVIDFNTNSLFKYEDYKDDIIKNLHTLKDTKDFSNWLDENYCATEIFFLNEAQRHAVMQEYLEEEYFPQLEDNLLDGVAFIKDCLLNVGE